MDIMSLYSDAVREYEKNKRKRLRQLKRSLWFSGAKPKNWTYVYVNGKWMATHAVDDMEVISQLDTYKSGKIGDIYFEVSYFEDNRRHYSGALYNWSDVKHFIGKRIVEKNETGS